MNGRLYDPVIGRFFSPDPYVPDAGSTQDFNRYSYARNNPLMYTDPDGEWIQYAIGGIIGGINGYMIGKSLGKTGWDLFGYTIAGAGIGALSAGTASWISSTGTGPIIAATASGAVSGIGFNGLATNGNIGAMLDGAWKGGLSGAVGGIFGSAIGGSWGAFASGVTSNITNQLLNDTKLKDINWGSVGISGLASFGIYQATSFYNWQWGGGKEFGDIKLKYSAYLKLNAMFVRSKFWQKEDGGWITNEGSFKKFDGAKYHKNIIGMESLKGQSDARYMVHTHYHTEGAQIKNSNGILTGYAKPYEPSKGDFSQIDRFSTEGMILTNRSLLHYTSGNYTNNWEYPLLRYFLPFFLWDK